MCIHRISLVCVVTCALLIPPPLHADSPPADTDLHMLAGVIVSLTSTSVLLCVAGDGEPSLRSTLIFAGLSTAVIGAGKELFDSLGYGTPEWRDLLNTLAGGLIGAAVVTYSVKAFPTAQSNSGNHLAYTYLAVSATMGLSLFRLLYNASQ